jgi:hypothetical protein
MMFSSTRWIREAETQIIYLPASSSGNVTTNSLLHADSSSAGELVCWDEIGTVVLHIYACRTNGGHKHQSKSKVRRTQSIIVCDWQCFHSQQQLPSCYFHVSDWGLELINNACMSGNYWWSRAVNSSGMHAAS